MRAPINALGPVAEDVIETLGFGYAVYGFVAALPIFLFGLMSPVVSRLLRRFSGERLFLAGLLLLIFGCWARGADDPLLFIAGTLVMGFGITQLNVLMPAVIKTGFKEKWPVMMSVYYILLISQTDHKVMVSKFGIIFHNMPQDRLFTDLDHWLWF